MEQMSKMVYGIAIKKREKRNRSDAHEKKENKSPHIKSKATNVSHCNLLAPIHRYFCATNLQKNKNFLFSFQRFVSSQYKQIFDYRYISMWEMNDVESDREKQKTT